MAIDLSKVIGAVTKTGFGLEYEIGCKLRKSGWHLISNRCYVDDLEGTVREVDLLAYKASIVYDVPVYTVIIISCKKSEANAWALFSRPVEDRDPNYDWRSFKGLTNHPAFLFSFKKESWSDCYNERMARLCPQVFSPPTVDVFAFQEISKERYTPQNDKNIFSSITSLVKAQAYEMSILEERNAKRAWLYQFNLLSVIDSDLLDVHFSVGEPVATEVSSAEFISSYIIAKQKQRSRIKFTTAKKFSSVLDGYNLLHKENAKYFQEIYDDFYIDCQKDADKVVMLLPDFIDITRPMFLRAFFRAKINFQKLTDISVWWNPGKNMLSVDIDYIGIDLLDIERLEADNSLCKDLSQALKEVFHYNGSFELGISIPF